MSEFRYRLMRMAIDSAVERAIPNLRQDSCRAVRNLVDLGATFASGKRQEAFFARARQIVSNAKSPYNALLIRLAREVDPGILRRVGVNLGYTALTCGSAALRRCSREWGLPVPWAVRLDCPGCTAAELSLLLKEGESYGISSWIWPPDDLRGLQTLAELCRRFPEHTFCVLLPPALAQIQACALLRGLQNAVVLLEVDAAGGNPFAPMRAQELLFGFVSRDAQRFSDVAFCAEMARQGCLFGIYAGGEPAAVNRKRRFVYAGPDRREPMLLIDWRADAAWIGREAADGGGYLAVGEQQARLSGFSLKNALCAQNGAPVA